MDSLTASPSYAPFFRQKAVPHLRTWPSIRLWQAGSPAAANVYRLAALLEEEGFNGRYMIYLTDASQAALEKAKTGGRRPLKKNIVFAQHSLATDHSFNEFQAIFCVGGLRTLDRSLQERAHRIFHESLCLFGFLSFGDPESFRSSPYRNCYQRMGEGLYRRIR